MLKNLFKPGWQNPDPEVRCRAVADIEPVQPDLLAEIARTDAAATVRTAALGRSDDLALLAERAASDSDAAVREQAGERYRSLLAGLAAGAPPLAERLQRVGPETPGELLEFLVRQGKEPELRAQALAEVGSVALLGELVLADPVAAVRHAALERLHDEPTLQRLQQESRENDKHVRRRIKEKLAAIRSARERSIAVAARFEALCGIVDKLGVDGGFAGAEQRMRQLELEWQAFEPEHRAAHESGFAAARQRFEERLAAYRTRSAQARSDREAVIARLETAIREFEAAPAASAPDLPGALREARSAWDQGPSLPAGDSDDLQARFDALCQTARGSVRGVRREAQLATLCDAAETMLARSGPLGEHEVKEWAHGLSSVDAESPPAGETALTQRVTRLHEALRDRLREQVAQKEEMLARLPRLLDELATAVDEGAAKRAQPLDEEIGVLLADLATIGVARERIGPLAARHRSLLPKVRVMHSWQRFGADQVRERLCAEVEALSGAQRDPPETARLLRAARTEWQGLSAGDPAREHKLRRRFEKAANLAYKPCKIYFDEQARARAAGRQRQIEVLARLDAFIADTDWATADWKAVIRLRRDTIAEWQNAGPVDHKQAKGLQRRLRTSLAALDAHLEPERQRCLAARERLIERVTALQQAPDPRRAVDECKRLQREWVATVPGRRREEAALWDRFRAACDGVFGERQRALGKQRDAWRENLTRKQALCVQAEALTDAGTVGDAQAELKRLQAEWREVGPVAKSDAAALERRFATVAEDLAKRRRADARRAQRDELRRLQEKAEICHAAETSGAADADTVATLETRWSSLPPLGEQDDERTITARFEQACRAARGDDEAVAQRTETEAGNRRKRETLCLRMEILAGIESPPEYAAARMSYQVERLASALGGRGAAAGDDTLDGLLREWCLSGAAPAADAAALETRFATASAAGAAKQG